MELCSRGCDSPLVPRAVRLLLRGGGFVPILLSNKDGAKYEAS